jgi:hypothetical protein
VVILVDRREDGIDQIGVDPDHFWLDVFVASRRWS